MLTSSELDMIQNCNIDSLLFSYFYIILILSFKVIIKNTIEFGFKGWMADFGEYLPYSDDTLFFDGTDGREWHNKFSQEWAELNMQVNSTDIYHSLIF